MTLSNTTEQHKDHHNHKSYGLPQFPRFVGPFNPRFIPDFVAWIFGVYGYAVGRWPYPFMAFGLILGLGCSTGLKEFASMDILNPDTKLLYNQFMEETSRYIGDADVIAQWKEQQKDYDNSTDKDQIKQQPCASLKSEQRFQSIMIVAKNSSLRTKEALDETFELAVYMRNLLSCDFDDLANKKENRHYCCEPNDIITVRQAIFESEPFDDMSEGEAMASFFKILRYPIDNRVPKQYRTQLSSSIGGVDVEDKKNRYNSRINGFKAMMSVYWLPDTDETIKIEDVMNRELWEVRKRFKHIDIYWLSFDQSIEEFARRLLLVEAVKVAITFMCVFIWVAVAALHTDAVDSKPLLGFLAIATTALAACAGIGIEFYRGKIFQTYLIAVPVMGLAIGLDDMFILMNAWRNTSQTLPREERSKLMMIEGGTSIFVTVLLTMIDFVIGSYTPYPAVQIFSDFSLAVLAFDFILQMLIYVPALVLTNEWEIVGRQSCCFWTKADRRTIRGLATWSSGYVICCSYGRTEDLNAKEKTPENDSTYVNVYQCRTDDVEEEQKPGWQKEENDNEFSTGKRIAYKYVSPTILHPITRGVVAIVTAVLLVLSAIIIWKKLKVGFNPSIMCNRKSNTFPFTEHDWAYFREFSAVTKIDVLIDIPASGKSFKQINDEIMEIVDHIEKYDKDIWGPKVNTVPFRLAKLENSTGWKEVMENPFNLTNGINFVRNHLSSMPQVREDHHALLPALHVDNNGHQRVGTLNEFYCRGIVNIDRGAEMITRLANVRNLYESTGNISLYMSNEFELLRAFDQVSNLPNQCIEFVLITVASTVGTSMIMLPHPICVFWMAVSSLCIIIQTLGGMALWNVSLDPIGLIYLLMSIGATADYICHCIYLFTIIEPVFGKGRQRVTWAEIRYEKARILVSELSAETIPAATGTLLSILILSTADNYILYSFFRLFLVAIIVGLAFTLIVLPGILCQFGPVATMCCQREGDIQQGEDNESDGNKEGSFEFSQLEPVNSTPANVTSHQSAVEIARLQQLRLYLLDTYIMYRRCYRRENV